MNKIKSVDSLVDGVYKFILKFLRESDVYLIFDTYMDKSVKSDTRSNRIGSFRRSHQLNISSDLPPKDICMSSNATKTNLVKIISSAL